LANVIYNVMYEIDSTISIGVQTTTDPIVQQIPSSDIISISIIHRYDTATYPIIRMRFYADMGVVENITSDPDNVYAGFHANGGIYKTDKDSNTTSKVASTESLIVFGKAYMENKNLPVSKMDQFKQGLRDETNLNVDSKVEFELFIYDEDIIHQMRQRVPSIYRDTTLETVCHDIMNRVGLSENRIHIDPVHNQNRYNQILIPNMMCIEAFTFFERYYGLYRHGGMLYYDITQHPSMMYLCDSSVDNGTTLVPIYVRSEKTNSDESGVFRATSTIYRLQTYASNASVLTESDIERVLNPERIEDVDVQDARFRYADLTRLFDVSSIDKLQNRIEQKNILHKSPKDYISFQEAARINEKITQIDLSGAGFDIALFKPNARVNLVFESPIRGLKIDDSYRMKYVCHVLTNTSGNLFVAQTAMNLCTNYGMTFMGREYL